MTELLQENRQITQKSNQDILPDVKVLDMPGRYTVAELARKIGIPPRRLCEYVNLGKLEGVKIARQGRYWAIDWDGKTSLLPSWNGKHLLQEALGVTKINQEFYCLNCNQHMPKKRGQVRQLYCSTKCRGQYVKKLNQQRINHSKTPSFETDGKDFNPANTFTIKELVEKSGIAEKTLHRYIRLGKLKGIRAAKIKGIWVVEWDGKTPLAPTWHGKNLHPDLVALGRLTHQRDDCLYCGEILIKKNGYKQPQTWCSKQCQGRYLKSLMHQKIISSGGTITNRQKDNYDLRILPKNESEPSIDAYDIYMDEIKNIPLLSYKQTISLIKTYQDGILAKQQMSKYPSSSPEYRHFRNKALKIQGATDQIVKRNLKLVLSIAQKHANNNMQLLDLTQEGCIGLLKAMERFDTEKGYQFSTYASWWIRQAITRTISNQARTIRIPTNINQNIVFLNRCKDELLGQLSREATDEELAKTLSWRVSKVRSTQAIIYHYLPLSKPLNEDGLTIADLIADPENFEYEVDCRLSGEEEGNEDSHFLEMLNKAGLTEQENEIFKLRYGYTGNRPWTYLEISKALQSSQKSIHRAEQQGLDKLKRMLSAN